MRILSSQIMCLVSKAEIDRIRKKWGDPDDERTDADVAKQIVETDSRVNCGTPFQTFITSWVSVDDAPMGGYYVRITTNPTKQEEERHAKEDQDQEPEDQRAS